MVEEGQGWLPSAPLDMEYDNNNIEQSTVISLNIQHNPGHIFPFSHIHVLDKALDVRFSGLLVFYPSD